MNLSNWGPLVRQLRVTNILLAARLRAERSIKRADPPSFARYFKRREEAQADPARAQSDEPAQGIGSASENDPL